MEFVFNPFQVCVTAVSGYILWSSIKSFFRRRNLPPGPYGLPLVGYAPFIPYQYEDHIKELFKTYGKVFSLNLYGQDVVMISDADLIKKIMMNDVFNSRPKKWMFQLFAPGTMITWTGEEWSGQRKFALRILKQLGLGKEVIESRIHDEIQYLFQQIELEQRKSPDQGVVMHRLLDPSASNIVSLLVSGERFDFDHPIRQLLNFTPKEDRQKTSPFGFINYLTEIISVAKMIPSSKSKQMDDRLLNIKEYFMSRMNHYKKTFDVERDDPVNFIEAYLKELAGSSTDKKYFDYEHCFASALSFFAAGSQTVKDFLEWFLQVMMVYPDVQEKMRQEIDSVVGRDGRICMLDKISLPYCEAVMTEVERYTSINPVGVLHAVSEDTPLGPYSLKEGTHIIMNLFAIHSDPEYFDEPHKFKPERFLSLDGKNFIRNDKVMGFGSGKRSCPGEPLARTEVFLYMTSFVQKYMIITPSGMTPTLEAVTDNFGKNPKQEVRCLFQTRNE